MAFAIAAVLLLNTSPAHAGNVDDFKVYVSNNCPTKGTKHVCTSASVKAEAKRQYGLALSECTSLAPADISGCEASVVRLNKSLTVAATTTAKKKAPTKKKATCWCAKARRTLTDGTCSNSKCNCPTGTTNAGGKCLCSNNRSVRLSGNGNPATECVAQVTAGWAWNAYYRKNMPEYVPNKCPDGATISNTTRGTEKFDACWCSKNTERGHWNVIWPNDCGTIKKATEPAPKSFWSFWASWSTGEKILYSLTFAVGLIVLIVLWRRRRRSKKHGKPAGK